MKKNSTTMYNLATDENGIVNSELEILQYLNEYLWEAKLYHTGFSIITTSLRKGKRNE